MSSRTVLCEAFDASKQDGTGISTYIRGLARAARNVGFRFDGLVHSFRKLSTRDLIAREIQYYDINNRSVPGFNRLIEIPLRTIFGVPFGISAVRLPQPESGFVSEGKLNPNSPSVG